MGKPQTNPFDGSTEPLTAGQALILIAERVAWGSQDLCKQVTDALRKEFDLELPEPDVATSPGATPEEIELAELRAWKREQDQKARDAEVAELKAAKAAAEKAEKKS